MSPALRRLIGYSCVIFAIAVGYYIYVVSTHPPSRMRETFLSEIGEGIGEIAMWTLVAIYFRTVVKLTLGKGPLSRRLMPDYTVPTVGAYLQRGLAFLDRTHTYLGAAAVALILMHIALMGLHSEIWFFPVVLALVVWQASFGLFLAWEPVPRELKRWSYFVHAQLITGVAIGIFAYFGHLLLDD
jgi:hypothetical protein